jgi:hypothetical protein
VATAQELFGPLQLATDDLHFAVTGSHEPEQHWPFVVQAASATVQTTFAPPVPGVPPPAVPPAPVPALGELFPQPGMSSIAVARRAAMAVIDSEVGEGFIPGCEPRAGPIGSRTSPLHPSTRTRPPVRIGR